MARIERSSFGNRSRQPPFQIFRATGKTAVSLSGKKQRAEKSGEAAIKIEIVPLKVRPTTSIDKA
jgi:hypothetical protein